MAGKLGDGVFTRLETEALRSRCPIHGSNVIPSANGAEHINGYDTDYCPPRILIASWSTCRPKRFKIGGVDPRFPSLIIMGRLG